MYEEAQKIFDYLPIEPGIETDYIKHLWGAFKVLTSAKYPVYPFCVLPLHLLFMFAIQYKVYRISACEKQDYLRMLGRCRPYDSGHRPVLEANPPVPVTDDGNIFYIPSGCSVRNLSLLREKDLFDFLGIIQVDQTTIDKAKNTVTIRSKYAHANGNIEEEIEKRIEEYLEILEEIQIMMPAVNRTSQNWKDEIEEGEYPLDDFFRERFLDSQFSPRDFGDVIQDLLEAEQLDFDQWKQIAEKGIDLCKDQAISALKSIAQNDPDDGKRFNANQLLRENNAA